MFQTFDCGKTVAPKIAAQQFRMPGASGFHDGYMVMVTFIGKKPSDTDAIQTLRQCLAASIRMDKTKDIHVTPFHREHAKADPAKDTVLDPFPEHRSLMFDKASGKVMLSRPASDPASAIGRTKT